MNKYVSLHFIMEFILIYQLLAFYDLVMYQSLPKVIPFVTLTLSGMFLYFVMKRWEHEWMPYIFAGLSLLMILVIALLFNFPYFLAIMLAIVVSFRLFSSLLSLDDDKDGAILVLTTFITLIQYFLFSDYQYQSWLVLFIFAQFILIVLKKMLQYLLSNPDQKATSLQVNILFSLIGVSLLLLAFLPMLRTFLHTLFVAAAAFVFSIIYPILNGLYSLLPVKEVEEVLEERNVVRSLPPISSETLEEYNGEVIEKTELSMFNPEILLIAFLCIAFLAFVFYVIFKGNNGFLKNQFSGFFTKMEPVKATDQRPLFRSRKLVPPANPIRRLVFHFEKKLLKTVVARKSSNTFKEWLDQLEGDANDKAIVAKIYHKVRYANGEVTPKEISDCKLALKALQQKKYKKINTGTEKWNSSIQKKKKEIKEKHYWNK